MSDTQRKHDSAPAPGRRWNDIHSTYAACLRGEGLSRSWLNALMGTARHMAHWLSSCGTDPEDVDAGCIAGFVAHDCACPSEFRPCSHRRRRGADRFFTYLAEAGLVELPASIVRGAEYVDAFTASLSERGYSRSTVSRHRRPCRHFIVWLHLSGLAPDRIDGGAVERFPSHRCDCAFPGFLRPSGKPGGSSASHRKPVLKFADFPVGEGVIGSWREEGPPAARGGPADGFPDWMRRHRGASGRTAGNYGGYLRRALLPELGDDPARYDVPAVRNFSAGQARWRSSADLAYPAKVARAYLRYLAAAGLCGPELAAAVPKVRRQPAADLPKYVSEAEIDALVGSCDTSAPAGLRDRAVMLLLARLALRAQDVVSLELSDIDWNRAPVRVSGKPRQEAALPLPQEVGDALKDYILKGRPRADSRHVFLRANAPHRAFACSSSVSSLVRAAMKRAGMDARGLPAAHLFRHSRATGMLRGGASPEAVAALLRHRSMESTALYARVDRPMLLEVAQPWIGGAP